MDRRDIRGIDAIIPPIRLLFFEISDTKVIIPEEIINFKIIYLIFYLLI